MTRRVAQRFDHGDTPARSVRLRLTALYGGLFLLCGAALLTITYLLVRHGTRPPPGRVPRIDTGVGPKTVRLPAEIGRIVATLRYQNRTDLHQLLEESAIALAGVATISVAVGWVLAGRVLARLQDAFEAQRRFVANASHELRTPLAMMRTRLDVAVAKPGRVPPQTRALDAGLRKDLARADALLESFLMLARAGHGALTDRTIVSLDRIVADALAMRFEEINEHELEVRTALDSVGVAGSETLLTRMVENVIENSVRHNQRHGFIDVTCETIGAAARLVVETGGPQLDEQSVARLAQPFRRLAVERTGSHNGQGLGLSIVAAVADAHAGALELRPRRGGGLRVQITLPTAAPSPACPVAA